MQKKPIPNLFEIPDFNDEQAVISSLFYEICNTKTVQGERLTLLNVGAYAAFNQINTNLPKYSPWKQIEKSQADKLAGYVLELMRLHIYLQHTKCQTPFDWYYFTRIIQRPMILQLLKKDISFSEADFLQLLQMLTQHSIEDFPAAQFIEQLNRWLAKNPLTDEMAGLISEYSKQLTPQENSMLDELMQKQQAVPGKIVYFNILQYKRVTYGVEYFPDPLALRIDAFLQAQTAGTLPAWEDLFFCVNKWSTTNSKPAHDKITAVIEKVGADLVKKQLTDWLTTVLQSDLMILESNDYHDQTGYLNDYTIDVLKGMLWLTIPLADAAIIEQLARLAMLCDGRLSKEARAKLEVLHSSIPEYRITFPEFNPLPKELSLTVIKVLGETGGDDAIKWLTWLREELGKNNEKETDTINKILDKAALSKDK